jgi:hypothetical protein
VAAQVSPYLASLKQEVLISSGHHRNAVPELSMSHRTDSSAPLTFTSCTLPVCFPDLAG